MDNLLVSIITPVYNAGRFLEESIRSVLAQDYTNWELWLVDDCSGDNSRQLIEQYTKQDQRIKRIYLQQNSGTAIARNKAIESAAGSLIAFLDADDLWKPDKLSKQIEFMQTNDYAFTFTDYEWIDEAGKPMDKLIRAKSSITYKQLLKQNTIGCLTAMYDINKIGKMYMPHIKKRQDYGLWLNILKGGIIAYRLPENLASYRITASSLSNSKSSVLKYNWLILRKHQNLSLISSTYYFICFIFHKSLKYLRL